MRYSVASPKTTPSLVSDRGALCDNPFYNPFEKYNFPFERKKSNRMAVSVPDIDIAASLTDSETKYLLIEPESMLGPLPHEVMRQLRAARRQTDRERLITELEHLFFEQEQKILQQERAASERETEHEFTQALLESLQEGIVACDANGTLTLFNHASRDFHGLPERPLPSEQWAEHFDLYEADGVTPMQTQDIPLFRALQGETVRDAEMVIAPQSGLARILLVSGQCIRSAHGKKLGAVVAMHDVTSRRQTERELARMAAILESSAEAVLGATLDGTLVSWNRAAERIYGYPATDMLGQHVSCLVPEGAPSSFRAAVTSLLGGETVDVQEVIHRRRAGTEFYASLSFSPIRSTSGDTSGEIVGVSCIVRDITARKKAEAVLAKTHTALAESQERFRISIDAMEEGLTFQGADGSILFCNESAERILGLSADQMMWLAPIDPRWRTICEEGTDFPLERHPAMIALQTGLPQRNVVMGIQKPNGELTWVNINAVPLWHPLRKDQPHGHGDSQEQEKAYSVVVTFTDITERRQAEEAQRTAERDYRSLFENAAEGIFRTTSEGTYLQANPALARLYGYDTPEELIRELTNIGSSLYVQAERRTQFQHLMRQQGGVSDFESQVYRKDKQIIWISENAQTVCDADGRVQWYEGFVQDVSERKALEAQQARALQEAQEKADLDSLTGLLNHRAFHRHLEEESDRAQRGGTALAVVMMDLDNFKFFNDVYGHIVGDQVLLQVAECLRSVCRSYDTIARFGGDEFALLLPIVDTTTRSEIEARLRKDLSGLTCHPADCESAIPIGVSVGVSLFPSNASERGEVLEQADERLRRAKMGRAVETEADQVRLTILSQVAGYSMLDALVTAVDNKDRYTSRHSEDVLEYSLMIARELGLDVSEQHTVAVAALLHDVGKIGVPDAVLRKPGKLTDEEFEAVKQHPQMGAIIVKSVPGLEKTLDVVCHHHERWDGNGYPLGLRGAECPLMARLMAVADAFSAMTTDRPYRRSMDTAKALSILKEGAGTQWDPKCVEAFLQAQGQVKLSGCDD